MTTLGREILRYATPGATELVRRILDPKRRPGPERLIEQPDRVDVSREEEEKLRREFWATHFAYADPWVGRSRTYDPTGIYNCGRCNMVDGTTCLLLDVDYVDPTAGSCAHWEDQCAGDAEMVCHYLSTKGSAYGQEAEGKGWGCLRCPYSEPAYAPDSMGRDLYCAKADCRVLATGCCAINGLKTVEINDRGVPLKGESRDVT